LGRKEGFLIGLLCIPYAKFYIQASQKSTLKCRKVLLPFEGYNGGAEAPRIIKEPKFSISKNVDIFKESQRIICPLDDLERY